MNIILSPEQFILDRIIFLDSRPNKMIDGYFTKINYSDEIITMQSLFFELAHQNINWLIDFEKRLIQYYLDNKPANNCKYHEDYKLAETLKTIQQQQPAGLIKISGIWENNLSQVGLSFRIT